MKSESNKVLIAALAANVGIAVAKFVAAGITGSSAMLTEGVHSLVDSSNQLLLMYGQKRAAKPPDAKHPGGYGRELYFWSFIVALLVFALGAGVSVYEGIQHFRAPEPAVSPLIAYGVLVFAFVLEGASTLAAFKEFNRARGGKSWWGALVSTKDATTVIVLLENGAAMAGLVIAAAGLGLVRTDRRPAPGRGRIDPDRCAIGRRRDIPGERGKRPLDRRGGGSRIDRWNPQSSLATGNPGNWRDHDDPQLARPNRGGDKRRLRRYAECRRRRAHGPRDRKLRCVANSRPSTASMFGPTIARVTNSAPQGGFQSHEHAID